MSILHPFHLPQAQAQVSHEHVGMTRPSALLFEGCLDLRMDRCTCGNAPGNAECPATLRRQGSFNWDWENGYILKWANLAKFELWRQEEEHIYSIELIASSTKAQGHLWSQHQLFVCGQEWSRGGMYTKKHPDWERKIETKKLGCHCQVVIKSYPHTPTILGCYLAEHNHEIGSANIAYTRLSGIAVTFLGLCRVHFSFSTCLLSLSHHMTNHPSISIT